MKYYSIAILLVLASFYIHSGSGCKKQTESRVSIQFPDKKESMQILVAPEKENLLQYISQRDIEIQTRKTFTDKTTAIEGFKSSFKQHLVTPSEKEMKKLNKVLDEVTNEIEAWKPGLLPNRIRLVLMDGTHYGQNVFYTLEDAIFIPRSSIDGLPAKDFKSVMIHECYHIISRYFSPENKDGMYAIFGYEKAKNPIRIPGNVKEVALTNPDGIRPEWYITCQTPDGEKKLLPYLVDKGGNNQFYFLHIDLRFYEIDENNSISKDKFYTINDLKDFNEITGGNTSYILHADEVLAENFVAIIEGLGKDDWLESFPDKGQEKLKELKVALEKL